MNLPTYDNETQFAGKRVVDFDPGDVLFEPDQLAYRVRLSVDEIDGDAKFTDRLGYFFVAPGVENVSALVIGNWGWPGQGDTSGDIVEALTANRHRLASLCALFLGDIAQEECEISWIEQSDLSPLWQAFPNLEHFRVRGGTGLSLGQMRLPRLRSLTVETGGLPTGVLRDVAAAELPELETLELWLGDDNYGWDGSIADVLPLLRPGLFPKLRHLGLRDAQITDDIAAALASSPILEQIETLDLSLGTLSDEGAAILAAAPATAKLKRLDIHFHYVSPRQLKALRALGIELIADDPQEPDDWDGEPHRYVAVSE